MPERTMTERVLLKLGNKARGAAKRLSNDVHRRGAQHSAQMADDAITRHRALVEALECMLRALGDDDCDLPGPRELVVNDAIRQAQAALAAEHVEPGQCLT